MAINYASKYSDKVDERFKIGAVTTPAVNADYDFAGVNTVNVYSVPTVAMVNYALAGANRYGTPAELQNSVQTLTLARDRSFTFTIDRRSYTDAQMVMDAGKALARQIDEVAIPEIDIYRIARMAAGAAAGNVVEASADGAAYSAFLDGINKLTDGKVPRPGRVAFVSPFFYKAIKLDASFIKAGDLAQEMLLKGQVGQIDGVPLVQIPTSYLPERVNFIITHPSATVSPIKLAEYKVHDNPPGINGWLAEGRFYYDAFVLANKAAAIYVNKEPVPEPPAQGGGGGGGGES